MLRSSLDALLARAARVCLRVFFREIEVLGLHNVHGHSGPLLLVANHVNNLVDPFLLLGFVGQEPRFLAKSTLFRHPVVAPILKLMGALPVYRRQDPGQNVARNVVTFARCRDILGAGGTVSLFPEGQSHNEPGTQPLKTGAARIALAAVARYPGLPLRVIPVGLVYENKQRFRSRVLMHVGAPIDPAEEAASYATEGRVAVRRLTARIAAGLEEVTVRFASWEEARLVDCAAELAAAAGTTLSARRDLWNAVLAAYRRLLAEDHERAARLVAALRAWDCGRQGAPRRARFRRAWALLLPALLGGSLNLLPYKLTGFASRRLTRLPDEPATYKLLIASLAFPLTWALEGALAWRLSSSPWAALGVLVLAPLSGYVYLLFREARGWGEAPADLTAGVALSPSDAAFLERELDALGGRAPRPPGALTGVAGDLRTGG